MVNPDVIGKKLAKATSWIDSAEESLCLRSEVLPMSPAVHPCFEAADRDPSIKVGRRHDPGSLWTSLPRPPHGPAGLPKSCTQITVSPMAALCPTTTPTPR
jgi:hypothetical protein